MPELPDNDPRKWNYTEHARAKHSILDRYLDAWFNIVGSVRWGSDYPLMMILDGFAGRGEYTTGEPGSPRIIFDCAAAALEGRIPARVMLLCGEANPDNWAALERVMAEVGHERIDVRVRQRRFEESAAILDRWLSKRSVTPPTFVFADPFGFSGIPLDVIRGLLSHEHVEVLLTFMARDMARFLDLPNAEAALTQTFGGESWVTCANATERPPALLLEYQRIVRPTIAKFATPFRVSSDERNETLYYLIHLTNHPLGMRRMKDSVNENGASSDGCGQGGALRRAE